MCFRVVGVTVGVRCKMCNSVHAARSSSDLRACGSLCFVGRLFTDVSGHVQEDLRRGHRGC